jgi:hypothetical protein
MNPGGLVIAIAGVWLGCQVFGGKMLERLGIVDGGHTGQAGGTAPSVYTAPAGPSAAVLPA